MPSNFRRLSNDKPQKKEGAEKSENQSKFEEQNVFALGPPIRPFFIDIKFRNLIGMRITLRNELIGCATIALWDSCNGLIFRIYEKLDTSTNGSELKVTREMALERCTSPETLFVGAINLRGKSKVVRFEDGGFSDLLLLRILLCRAFGYLDLTDRAADVHKANPLVYLGSDFLGSLSDILEQGRNRKLSPGLFDKYKLN